jgi:hypothetical protein
MKKGKTSKINLFKNIKCSYGTVDYKNLKSLYIVLQTWVEPKEDIENWERYNGMLSRNIKHVLLQTVNKEIFKNFSIVDLDLRSSGMKTGKRSFMNLEITLYLKNHIDFKSQELRNEIKKVVSDVYIDCLKNSKYLTFHDSKKIKEMV